MASPNLKIVLSKGRLRDLAKTLRVGEILCGKVIKRINKERYTVQFQGQRIVAAYKGALEEGMLIKTVVQSISPHIVLKIDIGHGTIENIDHLLGHLHEEMRGVDSGIRFNPNLGTILNDLKGTLDALQSQEEPNPTKEIVPQVTNFLAQLSLSGKIERTNLASKIKEIFLVRFQLPIDCLRDWIQEASVLQKKIDPEDGSSTILGGLENLREALKQLYINLALERDLLKESNRLLDRSLSFQLPFYEKGLFECIFVLLKKTENEDFLVRVRMPGMRSNYDFRLKTASGKIVMSVPRDQMEDPFFRHLEAQQIKVSFFQDEENAWDASFGEEFHAIDLHLPKRVNLVV